MENLVDESAEAVSEENYEKKQRKEIQAWKDAPPSITEQIIGTVFKPVAWLIGQVVPPSAVEGALRGADWLAQQTISKEQIFKDAGVEDEDSLRRSKLRELDALAESVHKWAIAVAVAEGGVAGAVGLAGIAADIPFLTTMAIRTVRAIGYCYGYTSDTEGEREFVLGVLAAAGANSIQEKTAALMLLRELEVTLFRQTFKAMAERAAQQAFTQEAAIIAVRDLAKQLGINFSKRKMLQAVPVVGAAIGATVNWTFMDDVALAARRSYQERWFSDHEAFGEL